MTNFSFSPNAPSLSDEFDEHASFDEMGSAPDWRDLIASPMEDNCLAPSDEAIGLAFDHYCEELAEPFRESEAEMADAYADIMGGIAELQIIAPDILDDILGFEESQDQQEEPF